MAIAVNFISGSGEDLGYCDRGFVKKIAEATAGLPFLPLKQTYMHNRNSNYSAYTLQYPYKGEGRSFADMLEFSHICLKDDILDVFLFGQILKVVYVNEIVCEINISILPIQTSIANGNKQIYDVLFTKSNQYSDTVPQQVIGEPITKINELAALNAYMKTLAADTHIAVVINLDLTPLGVPSFAINPSISGGTTILPNPLQPVASNWLGGSVGGQMLFFADTSKFFSFSQGLLNKEIYIKCFTEKEGMPVSRADFNNMALKKDEIVEDKNSSYANGRVDRTKIREYLVPFNITWENIISVFEVPSVMLDPSREPATSDLEIVIDPEPPKEKYACVPSVFSFKIITPCGDVFAADGSNILADTFGVKDNTASLKKTIPVQLIFIGGGQPSLQMRLVETGYILKVCDFPKMSITGISSDINGVKAYNRQGATAAASGVVSGFISTVSNFAVNTLPTLFTSRVSDAKAQDNLARAQFQSNISQGMFTVDKTTAISGGGTSLWKSARFHGETTHLMPATRERLNAVYARWGFSDYRQGKLDINTYKGYVQAVNVNLTSNKGGKFKYIDGQTFTQIAAQIGQGVYFA